MERGITRRRLATQRLTAPHAGSAAEVVRLLLGVQAENPGQSAWAVAARTATADPDELAGLLASGEVVRTHVLRSTWHYACRDDIDWLLALTGPRLRGLAVGQLVRDIGLAPAVVERLADLALELLEEQSDRTRTEMTEGLRARATDLAGQVTGRVVMLLMAQLELDRLVVSGAPRDDEHTYALWSDRIPHRVDLDGFDRDEALARLALRYFTGHGPATVKDLAYWATVTVTDVRRGLAAVGDWLASFEHDGRTYWHAAEGGPTDGAAGRAASDRAGLDRAGSDRAGLDAAPPEPRGHLLQLLDEMYRGYQDSRWVLDREGVVPRGREAMIGMALVDEQLVAGMKRTLAGDRVVFDLVPHRPLSSSEVEAIEAAAERYGAFLGRTPEVRVSPRA